MLTRKDCYCAAQVARDETRLKLSHPDLLHQSWKSLEAHLRNDSRRLIRMCVCADYVDPATVFVSQRRRSGRVLWSVMINTETIKCLLPCTKKYVVAVFAQFDSRSRRAVLEGQPLAIQSNKQHFFLRHHCTGGLFDLWSWAFFQVAGRALPLNCHGSKVWYVCASDMGIRILGVGKHPHIMTCCDPFKEKRVVSSSIKSC